MGCGAEKEKSAEGGGGYGNIFLVGIMEKTPEGEIQELLQPQLHTGATVAATHRKRYKNYYSHTYIQEAQCYKRGFNLLNFLLVAEYLLHLLPG